MEENNKIFLQIGMRVKIINNKADFPLYAGKIKTITADLAPYHGERAFCLDGDGGIWLIEDFEYCVDYPNFKMI